MPRAFKIIPNGHNLVKPNWNRFRPMKAVKKSQYLWIKRGLLPQSTPRAMLRRIRNPAMVWIQSVMIIGIALLGK